MKRVLFGAIAVLGCAPVPHRAAAPVSAPASAERRANVAVTRPQLVLSVVIDQLPSWAFERYRPHFSPDGAFARAFRSGAVSTRVAYRHAATVTAVGHATTYTGAAPVQSGIYANEVWDHERGARVPVVVDPRYPVFGEPERGISPGALRAHTVGDVLKRTAPGARVVSVSIKDRSAVLSGGKSADFAFWFDGRAGFTSSTYYARELPHFVSVWNERHTPASYLRDWTPEDPALLERVLGPDAAPGEGDWEGLGSSFPHRASASPRPLSAFTATPHATEYLLDFSRTLVEQLELGADGVPDLLAVSISATDSVGHVFGVESWEYLDNLRRTDVALGAFVDWLSQRARLSVLITSDHGAAPLPERSRAAGLAAERLSAANVYDYVEAELDQQLGAGDYVSAFVAPYLYLHPKHRGDDRLRLAERAARMLASHRGVELALAKGANMDAVEPELKALISAAFDASAPGDVYVLTSPHSIFDPQMPGGSGTHHGSAWNYDREVPVLFWGPDVQRVVTAELAAQPRVATTLSALLGIDRPEFAPVEPLPGAPKLRPTRAR